MFAYFLEIMISFFGVRLSLSLPPASACCVVEVRFHVLRIAAGSIVVSVLVLGKQFQHFCEQFHCTEIASASCHSGSRCYESIGSSFVIATAEGGWSQCRSI